MPIKGLDSETGVATQERVASLEEHQWMVAEQSENLVPQINYCQKYCLLGYSKFSRMGNGSL